MKHCFVNKILKINLQTIPTELEEEVGKKERDNEDLKLKLEENQSKLRDCREKMSDDARELEKATNKQV